MFKHLLVGLGALLLGAGGTAQPVRTGDWLERIDLDRLPQLRTSVCTQVASYDRTRAGTTMGFPDSIRSCGRKATGS